MVMEGAPVAERDVQEAVDNEHRLTSIESKLDQVLHVIKGVASSQETHEKRITTLEHRHIALGAISAFILVAAPFLFFYLDNLYEQPVSVEVQREVTPIP